MKKSDTPTSTKVSWKAAALIIGCSALVPPGLFTLWSVFHSGGAPEVENLGGFDRFGSLEGLTLRVGSHHYVCGGPQGQVVCEPAVLAAPTKTPTEVGAQNHPPS